MRIRRDEIGGVKFYHREGTSDLKTFKEVLGKKVYLKRGMKIMPDDFWYDCGANVGAFALQALALGAHVECFEPDPFACEILEMNLKLNGFSAAKINQAALVHDDRTEAELFCGKNGNYWRNSLLKNWDGKAVKVPCLNFDQVTADNRCIKMDIEGSEMPIIETTTRKFWKFVFEWSFDIDPDLERYWRVLAKLEETYTVKATDYKGKGVTAWPKSWFPACTNVFCYAKT